MLQKLESATKFYSHRWDLVPTGWNLPFDFSWMWAKGIQYGHLEWGMDPYDWQKPSLDLHPTAILMNFDQPKPDGVLGNVPACFYNTKLTDFSRKRDSGGMVFEWYKQQRYEAIETYIRQEAKGFIEGPYTHFTRTLPSVWRNQIAPAIRPPVRLGTPEAFAREM